MKSNSSGGSGPPRWLVFVILMVCFSIISIHAHTVDVDDTTSSLGVHRARRIPKFSHWVPRHSLEKGMLTDCEELFFAQRMDHFSTQSGHYEQRYFLNDQYYKPGGPLFFYLGNEADVTLYVNATGLMWENAPHFGALVVFAEHRYYGKSQLFPLDPTSNLQYLSVEQALMDYVTLIDYLKDEVYQFQPSDAVIGFGGSYGGMLASWGRFQYPHVWDGVVAGSAPIVSFEFQEKKHHVPHKFFESDFYAQGVTYDVTPSAGASPYCETNLRKLFANQALVDPSDNDDDDEISITPSLLRSTFSICDHDETKDADLGASITSWVNEALSYMSMGNFPYPSSYILNGNGDLPAFPVRVACDYLATDMTAPIHVKQWLQGLASFAGVYYNYTHALTCNTISAPVNHDEQIIETLWNYQYCSQIFQVLDTKTSSLDMFDNEPWDGSSVAQSCWQTYGFESDRTHFPLRYGTPLDWARTQSNIVWSQGEYDPWKGGGVITDLNDSLQAVVIPEAAHHLDLFFSHENDTQAVVKARQFEMNQVQKWITEKRQQYTSQSNSNNNSDEDDPQEEQEYHEQVQSSSWSDSDLHGSIATKKKQLLRG